ncbi:MAG TPA: hypothetical protein VM782_03635 [Stellaceae bacterium]|nr:hypothetical protein [Stellaceae bacterium]
MTTINTEVSTTTAARRTGWLRRLVMGTAFAAVGVVTLGAATTPAQAWWYYGYNYPYYYTYYPSNYGWYPGYYYGWGWHHHWHRHW